NHVIRAMIMLQLYTGARAGEIVILRPCDVERPGVLVNGVQVWFYRPESHKTEHLDRPKVILIGPKGQEVLKPFLENRPPEAYCFSPKEAVEAYLIARGRKIRRGKTRMPGDHYTTDSYDHAVRKACDRAKVPRWHSHQLRHAMKQA